jgi:hypothetical protein
MIVINWFKRLNLLNLIWENRAAAFSDIIEKSIEAKSSFNP